MNPSSFSRIPALLVLLFASLLAGAAPAAAAGLGADSVFKPGETSAATKAIGELAPDDEDRADGTDSPDPDAIHSDQAPDVEAPFSGVVRTPQAAREVASRATLRYRARAPPTV